LERPATITSKLERFWRCFWVGGINYQGSGTACEVQWEEEEEDPFGIFAWLPRMGWCY